MLRPKLCHEYYGLPEPDPSTRSNAPQDRYFDPAAGSPLDAIPELKKAYMNLYNHLDPDDETTWGNHGMPDYTEFDQILKDHSGQDDILNRIWHGDGSDFLRDECPIQFENVMFALRNYGCNCFPDNWDNWYWNINAYGEGQRAWQPGHNGKPVDLLDESCMKWRLRLKCIEMDYAAGDLPKVAPIERTKYYGQNGARLSYYDRYASYNESGWHVNKGMDQRFKMGLEECGQIMGYPWVLTEDGPVCGHEDNLDYHLGIPAGEECQAYRCFVDMAFINEVYQYIGPNLTEFFHNNRHNYLVYEKHPLMQEENYQKYGRVHPAYYAFRNRTVETWGEDFAHAPWLTPWTLNHQNTFSVHRMWDFDAFGPYWWPKWNNVSLEEVKDIIGFEYPYPGPDLNYTKLHNYWDYRPLQGEAREEVLLQHWYMPYSTAHEKCVLEHHEDPLGGMGELRCCGEYPERFPYRTGEKECCNHQIVEHGTCG